MDAALSPLFQAGAGFDYVRATEISGDKNDLPFIPSFRSHLHLTADSGLWWAGGRVQIVNSQNRVAPNEQSTERSEEHTSELQSRGHLVCRLLLEKKKKREAENLRMIMQNR